MFPMPRYLRFVRGVVDSAALSPDEIIYVGKLLKILRSPNKSTAAAIKYSVDAFLKAAEEPENEASSVPGAPQSSAAS